MEKIIISCLESRVETNRSIYARFLLGPFKDDNAVTIATALRRSLLSKVKSIAITAIHIQGVTHEFSTIVGVRESVLDLALNFQQVVLRAKTDKQGRNSTFNQNLVVQKRTFCKANKVNERTTKNKKQSVENSNLDLEKGSEKVKADQAFFTSEKVKPLPETVQIGYLQMRGPAVIYANDLKLPAGIECVDPTQYIATLSTEGSLVVKFLIGEKKASLSYKNKVFAQPSFDNVDRQGANKSENNFVISKRQSFDDPTACLRNTIFLDPIFDSVFQANYIIEKDDLFNQPRERIVLELWTNGSIHPRQALHKASLSLISTFSIFRKVFHLNPL